MDSTVTAARSGKTDPSEPRSYSDARLKAAMRACGEPNESRVGLAVAAVYAPNGGEGTFAAPGVGYGQPLALVDSFKLAELT